MMKTNRIWIAATALTLICSMAGTETFASGGVSDGGGGTTQPRPVEPQWVAGTASDYSGRILLSWLYTKEGDFNRLDSEGKQKSPFKKLFESGINVFDLVRDTWIELRMSSPCHDKNGNPWDGSIYAERPGAICISVFSITPKLNEINYQAEILALIMHELSHLMGTDEAEARAIQQTAIWDLSRIDMLDILVKQDYLAARFMFGPLSQLLFKINQMIVAPSAIRSLDLLSVERDFFAFRDQLTLQRLRASAVREAVIDEFGPQSVRLKVVRDWVRANDATEDADIRKDYAEYLRKAFAGKESATAKEILVRRDGSNPDLFTPEYDALVIRNPLSENHVKAELQGVHEFLTSVLDQLVLMTKLRMNCYRR